MKLFPLLIALLALALPVGLWASSHGRGGMFTDRADEASASVAVASPGAATYAAR